MCVCGCSLTLQLHKVGTEPAASSHAVVEVVEGEEVGGDGPGVSSVSRLSLQLAVCDELAQIHTRGTGHLQYHMTRIDLIYNEHFSQQCRPKCL